jgi:6-phosphogluconolactonase
MFVYVGTYTEPPQGKAEGLYVYRFDPMSGALLHVQTVAGIANPSFLAMRRDGRYLYTVNELDEGQVTACARDPASGELTALNSQLSQGAAPCFIALDPSERYALVANYNGETVAALPIAADGRLGPATSVVRHTGSSIDPDRQREPHPHMIAPTPDGHYLLAPDLGTDQVVVYRLDAGGELRESRDGLRSVSTTPGSGPRHFAFSPNDRAVYLINELDSTIAVYAYDGESLNLRQTVSTLPAGFAGESTCAEIAVSPDGRFVYGSNRGHDSIAIFAVDAGSGTLSPVGFQSTLGQTPRMFALDPSGSWLLAANQDSGTIATFHRDAATGLLTVAGDLTTVPTPVAILFA